MNADRPAGAGDQLGRSIPVDALAIGVVGIGAAAASLAIAPGWIGIFGAALAAIATVIAFVDCRWLIIPDELNALAFLIGLLAIWRTNHIFGQAETHAFLRAAVMFVVFYAFRAGYRLLRRREGLGLGDVKLAAVAGVWLNWSDLPIAVDIAAVVALTFVLLSRLAGKKIGETERLPFGLFFAAAIWICWFVAVWRGDWAAAALQ